MTIDQAREAILSTDFGARIADTSTSCSSCSGSRPHWRGERQRRTARRRSRSSAARAGRDRGCDLTGAELRAIAGTIAPKPSLPSPSNAGGGSSNLAEHSGRHSTLSLNGMSQNVTAASPYAGRDLASNYLYFYTDDIMAGLIVDARNKTVLGGSLGDYPALGAGAYDAVELDGDYSAGFDLVTPTFVDQIVARAGNDYNLIADDDSVAAGGTLTVNAMPLKADNRMIFDGTAETDGRFLFFGSESGDVFLGGAGDDRILGLGGADILSGGAAETLLTRARPNPGADFDILADSIPRGPDRPARRGDRLRRRDHQRYLVAGELR